MTKTVRIENADPSDYKVVVEVWERGHNGAPDKLVQERDLGHPTAMLDQTIWKERYLKVREGTLSDNSVTDRDTAPDGWYWLSGPQEPFPTIVRLYTNPDCQLRGLGYNIADGAFFQPLFDLKADSVLVPVQPS